MDEILIIGGGGHARACIDVIEAEGRFKVAGLILKGSKEKETQLEYPILGFDDDLPDLRKNYSHILICIGQIAKWVPRVTAYDHCRQAGFTIPVIISPLAYVSPKAKVGQGTIIMHHAIVNSGSEIGENCILNSRCLVEHDVVVGNHCHVSTGAIVNGHVVVGAKTFLGSGSVTENEAEVLEESVVPALALVRRSLDRFRQK